MSLPKPIRIAYLVSRYPALSHTYILREIRQLRALDVEPHVISISAPDLTREQMTEAEREESATTFYVKPLGLLGALWPHVSTFLSRPLSYLKGMVYALRLAQFSPKKSVAFLLYFAEAVIVGHWMQSKQLSHVHIHFSTTVGLIAKKIFPITISSTIHGSAEFNDPIGFKLTEKIAACSFVCAISYYGQSQLMKSCDYQQWDKLEVAPLGIDPAIFAPRPFRENPVPLEIISVGLLAPVKAQHILIKAIDRLVKEGRNVRLRLVGDGPDREALEQHVATLGLGDHVIFTGRRNQDEVREHYKTSDVFALASFAEGLPVVLMEAMAMEIPCVATRITGIPELIRDGADGLLVTPSDYEMMAQAIEKLIDDPTLRRRLGEAGRRRVVEKYNLSRNTAHLVNIFRHRIRSQLDYREHEPLPAGAPQTASAQVSPKQHRTIV